MWRFAVERLESRSLMAGDLSVAPQSAGYTETGSNFVIESRSQPEGEAADDLVAFAKALAQNGHKLYGADWNSETSRQRRLFQDGADFLDFIEVTNSDQSPNDIAGDQSITTYPTWLLGNGIRLEGFRDLAQLADATGIAIPKSSTPSIKPLANETVLIGSPLHIPIDAYDPNGNPLTITVSSSNPSAVTAVVLQGYQSARFTTDFGDMTFRLFDIEAPRPTYRFAELAQTGFYNTTATQTMTFHRIIETFVIQGGDPRGNGTGGSDLGAFDDQFNLNLQHNRSGVLSYAKSDDDTNNSQFFITAGPTRNLDFNHSIFGQLVEGESTRAGIGRTAVVNNTGDPLGTPPSKPVNPVQIKSVDIFNDLENGLVRLRAVGAAGTQSTITVTATDTEGNSTSQTFVVTVAADANADNGGPFLKDIPVTQVTVNQPINIQLTAQDKEGDQIQFLGQDPPEPVFSIPDTGLLQIPAQPNVTGRFDLFVAVQPVTPVNPQNIPVDVQQIFIEIGNPMTLSLSQSTLLEGAGESITATLTRQAADISQSLTVNVRTSLANRLNVPQTVTFAANQATVTFQVQAVVDNLPRGSREVILSTDVAGFWSTSKTIDVIDKDSPNLWHKSQLAADANNDGVLAPVDVLVIINRLSRSGTGVLGIPNDPFITGLYDVNNDFNISPIDVLQVINALNRRSGGSGEGERNSSSAPFPSTLPSNVDKIMSLWLIDDPIQQKNRNRNR